VGDAVPLKKAKLIELDAAFKRPAPRGHVVEVQFNPESLKVTFANRTQEQKSPGDQRGNSTRQVPGAGATKLALQLWFDVTAPGASGAKDVRVLTEQIAYFMLPKASTSGGKDQKVPPGVRFSWGTFTFDGLMDAFDETLDYFSPDGKPLRASLSISLSGQVGTASTTDDGPSKAAAGPTPGTRPLVQAPGGAPLQSLTDRAVSSGDWQAIAAANGIDNPRLLSAGQLLDLGSASIP
jgi:contractile injection system tube protein